MNTTQVCVVGIVAVVALGFVADMRARFKKSATPEVKPRMTKQQMHRAIINRAAQEHTPGVAEAMDIVGRTNMDAMYR